MPEAQWLQGNAAVVREQGQPFQLEDVMVDAPGPDEVRVRLRGVGICHTDMVCRDGFPVPLPIVLGHEGAGVVESVGENVQDVAPGDHVVLSFNACGECGNCRQQRPAACADFMALNFGGASPDREQSAIRSGDEVVHGNFFGQSSFASVAVASRASVVPVSRDQPLELLGPLGCGVQTGAGAVMNSLQLRAGESLAVFGGGAVGLSALMAARASEAASVMVIEPNEARRRLATELGADHVVDPSTADDVLERLHALTGGGVHYALDTTGIPDVIGTAAEAILPGGTLGLLGVSPMDAQLPVNIMSMIMRGLTIRAILEGDSVPHQFIPKLLDLYQEGRFPFDRLVEMFEFSDINEAVAAAESGAVIKPVVRF